MEKLWLVFNEPSYAWELVLSNWFVFLEYENTTVYNTKTIPLDIFTFVRHKFSRIRDISIPQLWKSIYKLS